MLYKLVAHKSKTMLQKLKPDIKKSINYDQELQLKIAKALHKRNIVTVQRWVKSDHPYLTLEPVQDIIRKHLKLSEDTVLIDEEVPEPAKVPA